MRIKALLALLFGLMLIGIAPASAATYTNSWTTTQNLCGVYLQGHYMGASGDPYDGPMRRMDGYSVNVSGHGYVRQVTVWQEVNGGQHAERNLNFTGTATSSSTTGISASYLPWKARGAGQNIIGGVYVKTSTGLECEATWNIS